MGQQRVDVLAVLDQVIEDCVWLRCNSVKQMEVTPEELEDARAAIAGLIEAAKKAQYLLATPARIEARHREELSQAIGRCIVANDPRFAPTASDVKVLRRAIRAFEPIFHAVRDRALSTNEGGR